MAPDLWLVILALTEVLHRQSGKEPAPRRTCTPYLGTRAGQERPTASQMEGLRRRTTFSNVHAEPARCTSWKLAHSHFLHFGAGLTTLVHRGYVHRIDGSLFLSSTNLSFIWISCYIPAASGSPPQTERGVSPRTKDGQATQHRTLQPERRDHRKVCH